MSNNTKTAPCLVTISNATLATVTVDGEERLVIQGILDTDTLVHIKAADYQREVISGPKQRSLMKAAVNGILPVVELGVRGDKHEVRDVDGIRYNDFTDPVYVIDGLQRISAAIKALEQNPSAKIMLGATIHVDTTEKWEKARFTTLNMDRARVSANVLIRNCADINPAVKILHSISGSSSFVLCNRVQWTQRMGRSEILTALNLCRVAGALHCVAAPGCHMNGVAHVQNPDTGLNRAVTALGGQKFTSNIKHFYDIVDQAFNLRDVVFNDISSQIKGTFQISLALIFASNAVFWKDGRLFIDSDTVKKLRTFPLNDPNISRLAGGNTQAGYLLRNLIVGHINRGRRINRIRVPEADMQAPEADPTQTGDSEENGGSGD